MSNCYRVIFCGDVVHGYDVKDVKKKLALILQEDAKYVERIFSGQTIVIKKDPDLTECEELGNMFLEAGAVCYIEDPDSQVNIDLDLSAEDSTLQVDTIESTPSIKKTKKLEDAEGGFSEKISGASAQIKSTLNNAKRSANKLWGKASESIKSDLDIGGMEMLVKNKYFLGSLVSTFTFLFLVIALFTYEGKAMPLTEKNYNQVINHIGFVEKAFTVKELAEMKRNPADFLDYLIVDPIEKMGYEFEASILDISNRFLKEKYNSKKQKRAITLLKILTPERYKLYEVGIISKDLKEKLDNVSKKI